MPEAARSVQAFSEGVAPGGEGVSVVKGHAEDLADHGHGQGRRPVAHEIDRPIARQRVDQSFGDAVRGITPRLHYSMGEGRLHELADAGVVGTVLGDDCVEEGIDAVGRWHGTEEDGLEGVASLGDVRGGIRRLQDGRADVVARCVEHPAAAAYDRLGAQAVGELGEVVARLEASTGVAEQGVGAREGPEEA